MICRFLPYLGASRDLAISPSSMRGGVVESDFLCDAYRRRGGGLRLVGSFDNEGDPKQMSRKTKGLAAS